MTWSMLRPDIKTGTTISGARHPVPAGHRSDQAWGLQRRNCNLNKLLSQSTGLPSHDIAGRVEYLRKAFCGSRAGDRTHQEGAAQIRDQLVSGRPHVRQSRQAWAGATAFKTAHQIDASSKSVTQLHLAMVRAGMNSDAESLINDWLNKRRRTFKRGDTWQPSTISNNAHGTASNNMRKCSPRAG